MKKVVEQKPVLPPIPHLDAQEHDFWTYHHVSEADAEAINSFLQPVVHQFLPQPTTIEDSYFALCQMLSLKCHPALKQKKTNNILNADNSIESVGQPQAPLPTDNQTIQFLIFQNTQIDLITLKLLNFLWSQFPSLQVLKIFNIQPDDQEIAELCNLVQNNKVSKLFLEFLPLTSDQLMLICEQLPRSQALTQVYLRGNHLTDDHLTVFVRSLEENQNTQLKYIEMTYNHITKKGIQALAQYMKKANKLEYLGFAKNGISCYDDIKDLADVIVKKKLNPEELQAYRDLEAQREAQIKNQQKNKGKKPADEAPLIQLEPIAQNADGSIDQYYFMVSMKVLNLAMSGFSEPDKDLIDRFMGQVAETFQLVLIQSQLEAKVKDKLKKKYRNLLL